MIVVFLCCMMKLVEFSVGKPLNTRNNQRKKRYVRKRGIKGMTEGVVPNKGLTPDSDCNSNHQNSSSYLSVSSQDVDFIQDNSDYQWFLDYNYRDGSSTNHHPSLLSLPESYEAGDVNYYETLAKNMDANLAEADMESFRTEDIHALLTNLPPMCTDHLSQESHRQGEFYASVSGSMMAKFELDNSSISPHYSSSQGEDSTSMSICKSELLFSPVKEAVPVIGGAHFSVDSLDCDFHDMMLTCQANKDNYTIAFEGSITMYSEESDDFNRTDDKTNSAHFPNVKKMTNNIGGVPMTQSDSGSFTTWSKLRKNGKKDGVSPHHHQHRLSSGNNNNSGDETTHLGLKTENIDDDTKKSQSMPNLCKKKSGNKPDNMEFCEIKPKPVKVFNIQHQISSNSTGGASVSDMATSIDLSSTNSSDNSNKQTNFSLFKLFMKQKSISTEGMSTTASSTENWQHVEENVKSNNNNSKIENGVNRSIQTSTSSVWTNLKNPVRVIEPSFLEKLKKDSENKPVYVLYPNYVLPNLDFLNNEKKKDITKVLLMPQNVKTATPLDLMNKKRPFSCNDIETLKTRGFSHVKDWDSLNFLLPPELKEMLKDIPEISSQRKRSKFKNRPQSFCENCNNNVSSSSSSGVTQPSSGYRGSSASLESATPNLNPLFVYRYDSATSSETSFGNTENREKFVKKISQQEPYFYLRNKRLSETEDEGVDAGNNSSNSSSLNEPNRRNLQNLSVEELIQFEEFLKCSGISSASNNSEDGLEELSDENLSQLRSCVSKFLALKMNQDGDEHQKFGRKPIVSFAEKINVCGMRAAPNNSPNVSAAFMQKNYENKEEISPYCNRPSYNMVQKWSLINGVTNAVDLLTKYFSTASNENELSILGNSNTSPECAKIALNHLCPALYAVLSDGLKPDLETSFGNIQNSVWQVVEASAKQGPLTKALNELVMKINGEDVITEGLVKFNTFVFGLLNVRSLDAWASYLRTRESVLKKHYENDSLLVLSYTGGPNIRLLMDKLITALQPLAVYPFQLDLFYETKQLHMSMKRMEALSPTHKFKQWISPVLSTHSNKSNSDSEDISTATTILRQKYTTYQENSRERPRSCIESGPSSRQPNFKLGEDVTMIAKKRWSNIALNSKLFQVYDKLDDEDDYTDSLENNNKHDSNGSDENFEEILKENDEDGRNKNGKRFRKLQEKWEMMSDGQKSPMSTPSKSRIPRLITSPVKPIVSGIPLPQKKVTTPPGVSSSKFQIKNSPAKRISNVSTTNNSRTSRLDEIGTKNHHPHPRPSSLPYKPIQTNNTKLSKIPPRRAVSSSLNRKPTSATNQKTPKIVRTVSHRLPSESGHLSYNEGENLKVILKVDEKWLLCCRGNQKGLVPISAVISADNVQF